MQALIEALRTRGPELAARSIEEMYRDPFWTDRFGERGRTFADQDGLHHLNFLVQALVHESVDILADYARWLQVVLAARGMCTEHVRENFERMSRLIREAALPDSETAQEFLRSAEDALRYPAGAARQVQDVAGRVAPALPAEARRDAHLLVSYLADAVRLGDPALFARHVAWLRAHGYAHTNDVLKALARESLPGEARKALEAAR